jgi:hypothetical protein
MKWTFLTVALLLACGCATSRPPGAVSPAPPGPIDAVRSMWGDYSGRCPDGYQYCSAASQAICCPIQERCEEDSGGAYCVPRNGHREASGYGGYDNAPPPRASMCLEGEITCSYMGRTTCCASNQRCCAGDGGPACCDSGAP